MKILMLGASLEQNGGIASAQKLMIEHIAHKIQVQYITSHDEGSIIHRTIVFAKALIAHLVQ